MVMMTRKDWASKDAIMSEVADVPENWLRGFAVRHPADCRKFAATRNGSMMYRVEAVLKAIEDGEAMPNAGIVDRGGETGEVEKIDFSSPHGAATAKAKKGQK